MSLRSCQDIYDSEAGHNREASSDGNAMAGPRAYETSRLAQPKEVES
jgi:hypothetical protein